MLIYLLSLSLITALFVINTSIISAVISFIITVILVSFILFFLNINYVGIVYLLVYVGAILILLIFVVLAAPITYNNFLYLKNNSNSSIFSLLNILLPIICVCFVFVFIDLDTEIFHLNMYNAIYTVEHSLAQEFFSSNILPLITVSILLFICIVGSIDVCIS